MTSSNSSNRNTRLKARLLASATTGVVALHLGAPAMAQSSVDIDLLDQQPTQLSTATALIANLQIDTATSVVAAAAGPSGAVDIRIDLLSSGFVDTSITGSFEANTNTISAEAYSNSATNRVSATTTPTFADSSAVVNAQSNNTNVSAVADDNSIVVNIEAVDAGSVRTLSDGTVTIDGNEISAASNGNTSTNTITIADAVSVTGTGAGTATVQEADRTAATGTGTVEDVIVDADLVVANAQINDGDPAGGSLTVQSAVSDAAILADIEAVSGSTVSVSDNVLSAASRGNTGSSTIDTGSNAASINASMAVTNLQTNENAIVQAGVFGSRIAIDTSVEDSGATIGSTLMVDNNDLLASAYGNNGTQTLSIDANAINGATQTAASISSSTGAGYAGDALTTEGMATITSLQMQIDSPVTAQIASSTVEIEVTQAGQDDLRSVNNTVTVSNTTMDATAVGNRSVSSAVSLTGNDVGTGVAVASSQLMLDSTTQAIAVNSDIMINEDSDSGATGSSLTVESSLVRALALSNTAGTTITVNANDVTAGNAFSTVSYDSFRDPGTGDLTGVNGSFITLNDQFSNANALATASGNAIGIRMSGGDTDLSSLDVTSNAILAAAIGNDGSNAISLSANNIASSGDFATIAAAVSQQQVQNGTISADAVGSNGWSGGVAITTNNDVDDSSLTVSGNSVEAMAMANRVTANTVTVDATNVDTQYIGPNGNLTLSTDLNEATASFMAVNIQTTSGATIDSFLTDTVSGPAESMTIATILGDDIRDSTAAMEANSLKASSTANSAANGVVLTVGGTSQTSAGVLSEQISENNDLNVTIGVAGTPAVSYAGFTVSGTTVNDSISAGIGLFTGSIAGLTSEQIAYLAASYGSSPGYNLNLAAQTISFAAANNTNGVSPVAGTVAGTDQIGGVVVDVANWIDDSTVTVAGNLTEGKATGNTVTNTLSLSGNMVFEGDTDSGFATANWNDATASNMILSKQETIRSGLTVNVAGEFAIDTVTDNGFSGSVLTVSGNTQQALATENTATSTLSVSANEVRATSALSNSQSASGFANTSSDLWVYAPTAINNSDLSLADNLSQAQSRQNVATNTVTIAGTTLSIGSGSAETDLGRGVSGGVSLYNEQYVELGSDTSSFADIVVFNEHSSDTTTVGTQDSSIAFTGNTALAESTANRATNTLSLDGTNVDSVAALGSDQINQGDVDASATGTVTVDMTSNDPADSVVLNSSVMVDGNAVSALATANQVSNAVNISATNVSGGDSMAEADTNNSAFGTFVLGNNQFNDNAVSAAAANVTFSVELNTGAATGNGANGSTVTVDGNATTAQALGNRSTNALNATVTNTADASYAINQNQLNNGDLSATVTSLDAGITADGVDTVVGSTLSVAGNSSLANAIGNTTSNTLVLNASSVQSAGGSANATGSTVLNATAGIANGTTNNGDIEAATIGVSYGVALNASDEAMNAASIDVSGNSITSQAIANSGYNSLTVVALADDTANYGVSNYQGNTGDVTARVQTADIGVRSVGAVSGSMTSVSSNAVGSVAIGNTVTNVLLR